MFMSTLTKRFLWSYRREALKKLNNNETASKGLIAQPCAIVNVALYLLDAGDWSSVVINMKNMTRGYSSRTFTYTLCMYS